MSEYTKQQELKLERHEFQMFAFHPKKADILVCLNYNKHPSGIKHYTINEQDIYAG